MTWSGIADASVSVIVPCWNRPDLLVGVLECLRAQTYPIREILVADDGSSEDLSPACSRFGAHLIRLPEHRGFAAAVNRGFDEALS